MYVVVVHCALVPACVCDCYTVATFNTFGFTHIDFLVLLVFLLLHSHTDAFRMVFDFVCTKASCFFFLQWNWLVYTCATWFMTLNGKISKLKTATTKPFALLSDHIFFMSSFGFAAVTAVISFHANKTRKKTEYTATYLELFFVYEN